MNILICGSLHSGCERILRLIIHIFKQKELPLNVIQNYQKNNTSIQSMKNTSNDHKVSTVCVCTNFWDVYSDIKEFDHVITCIRDCRTICNTVPEMIKYCEGIQCWNIFSNVTLKYELYGPSQIIEITQRLELPFNYTEIIEFLEKVRITTIKENNIEWNENEIKNTFLVNKYLHEFGYYNTIQKMKEPEMHHSVSWSS